MTVNEFLQSIITSSRSQDSRFENPATCLITVFWCVSATSTYLYSSEDVGFVIRWCFHSDWNLYVTVLKGVRHVVTATPILSLPRCHCAKKGSSSFCLYFDVHSVILIAVDGDDCCQQNKRNDFCAVSWGLERVRSYASTYNNRMVSQKKESLYGSKHI